MVKTACNNGKLTNGRPFFIGRTWFIAHAVEVIGYCDLPVHKLEACCAAYQPFVVLSDKLHRSRILSEI